MTEDAMSVEAPQRHSRNPLRPQDFAWLLLIVGLIATTPETNYNATILLVLLGAFQIAEPRLKPFSSPRGQIASVGLKLLFSYLIVGYTHTIFGAYFPIFLIPVVSAATIFEWWGVALVTAIASLAYFSFLLFPHFIDWHDLPDGQLSLMALRTAFFDLVAFLVYDQAKAKRNEMERTQQAAARLAESNENLRAAQASLRRSERLAALGQLTAGLAHELRNPLGTIKASAEMLVKTSSQNRPAIMSEMAGYIRSEADRMNALISSFLDFARPLQIRAVSGDICAVINEVVRQQASLAEERQVSVSVHVGFPCPASFPFDPDLLQMAVSNLLQNAIQASAPRQHVLIEVEDKNENVRIVVRDQGEGIQPQHLESIFNPFFTTKPQGVGLGLAIVSKIIDEHQGRIEVTSELGKGTAFEITLPKLERA